MHTYKVLYLDGSDKRRLVDVELPDGYKVIGIQRYTDLDSVPNEGVANGSYPIIDNDNFNDVYGKLLTLCDATFSDTTQRTAFKDMVKNTLSDWYGKNVEYVYKMTDQIMRHPPDHLPTDNK